MRIIARSLWVLDHGIRTVRHGRLRSAGPVAIDLIWLFDQALEAARQHAKDIRVLQAMCCSTLARVTAPTSISRAPTSVSDSVW